MSSSATIGSPAPDRRRSAVVLLTGLAIVGAAVLAIGGFAWYRPAGSPPPAAPASSAALVATAAAAPSQSAERLFARRMYLEQAQSATNLDRLAEGKITGFEITDRKVGETTATIGIVATFADGSRAPGEVGLVRDNGSWYLFSMEGQRSGSTKGYAGGVDKAENDAVASFRDVPDSAVDWDLADEMVRQQTADQEYLKGIVDGSVAAYQLGKPVRGAGTVSIDAIVRPSAKGATPRKVRVVLVPSTFEGRKSYFMVSMRSQ